MVAFALTVGLLPVIVRKSGRHSQFSVGRIGSNSSARRIRNVRDATNDVRLRKYTAHIERTSRSGNLRRFMTDREDEITAWHESGHAFAAAWLGADIESVSIDPDADDGPQRFGDIVVRWDRGRFSDREISEKSVMVALSGPVTEMIHRGDPLHPATVSEWSQDWALAWAAADFVPDNRQRLAHLEQVTRQLYQVLSMDHHWAAVGAIVDHLLAHDSLEGATVHEIVSEWT